MTEEAKTPCFRSSVGHGEAFFVPLTIPKMILETVELSPLESDRAGGTVEGVEDEIFQTLNKTPDEDTQCPK